MEISSRGPATLLQRTPRSRLHEAQAVQIALFYSPYQGLHESGGHRAVVFALGGFVRMSVAVGTPIYASRAVESASGYKRRFDASRTTSGEGSRDQQA